MNNNIEELNTNSLNALLKIVEEPNENLFFKKNKFKGKIGIFEINKKTITHQLNFYVIEEKTFKEIF